MPPSLRNLFTGSAAKTAAAQPAPVPALVDVQRSTPADQPVPTATPGSPAAAAAPANERSLHDDLHGRLTSSLHQLDGGMLEASYHSGDVALLMRALRDDPIAGIRQLPVAAQRAMSLLHSEASTKMLVQLFEQDPAMTQALVRQVNTTYYNPSGMRIVSLTDAINRMGRAGIQSVVFEQALAGMVSRPGGQLDVMAQHVWTHMVRTAPIARQLARSFGVGPDEAFLLGLLHDVGKLVVFDRVTELRGGLRRTVSIDLRFVAQTLRLLHEPLGGIVLGQWGLGDEAARAVGSHHRDPAPPANDALSEVIFAAERVELAQSRKEPPDFAAIWALGKLSGDKAAAESAVATPLQS